jgi:methionyl-tRNA formyltransferase
LRIIFMGTPEMAVPALTGLVRGRYTVVAVYTQPDRPAGRGRAPVPSPVKRSALELGLPVVQTASLKDGEVLAQLAGLAPDVIVVAAYGQLLPEPVLRLPRYGCVNIHPSLLPRHRGASPVAAAILAGDEFTGVSIMQMDAGWDTGPIFLQAQIPISPQDTTGSLTASLSYIAAGLLQEVLVRLVRADISLRLQDSNKATCSKLLEKKDGEIDWTKMADEIWRRVRAFHPWPGSYTLWQGKQLKIIEALPLHTGAVLKPGEVAALPHQAGESMPAFVIGTGNGNLGILRLQLEGKQAMSSADFLRGQRHIGGAILPSD